MVVNIKSSYPYPIFVLEPRSLLVSIAVLLLCVVESIGAVLPSWGAILSEAEHCSLLSVFE